MKNTLLLAALACLALTSCEGPKKNEPPKPTAMNTMTDANRPNSETDQDRRIAEAVRQAISAKRPGMNVVVTTRAGTVQLRGQVATPSAKDEIAEIARKASGGKPVDNQIEIKQDSY